MNLPESALVLSAAKLHSVISVGSKNLAVSVLNGALISGLTLGIIFQAGYEFGGSSLRIGSGVALLQIIHLL